MQQTVKVNSDRMTGRSFSQVDQENGFADFLPGNAHHRLHDFPPGLGSIYGSLLRHRLVDEQVAVLPREAVLLIPLYNLHYFSSPEGAETSVLSIQLSVQWPDDVHFL